MRAHAEARESARRIQTRCFVTAVGIRRAAARRRQCRDGTRRDDVRSINRRKGSPEALSWQLPRVPSRRQAETRRFATRCFSLSLSFSRKCPRKPSVAYRTGNGLRAARLICRAGRRYSVDDDGPRNQSRSVARVATTYGWPPPAGHVFARQQRRNMRRLRGDGDRATTEEAPSRNCQGDRRHHHRRRRRQHRRYA